MVYSIGQTGTVDRKSIFVQKADSISNSQKISGVMEAGSTCQSCPLNKATRIDYFGPPNSDVCFLFDVPPPNMKLGTNLLYTAGFSSFVTALIRSGFSPDKCGYLFLVRCATPLVRGVQRNPNAEEISCCWNFFQQDFKKLSAKYIVVFGDVVLKKLFGIKYNVMKSEGIPLNYEDKIVIPTYSWRDFSMFPEKFVRVIATLSQVKNWVTNNIDVKALWKTPVITQLLTFDAAQDELQNLCNAYEFGCDIETDGTELTSQLYSISFSTGEKTIALPWRFPNGELFWSNENERQELIRLLGEILSGPAKKIFHYSTFDCVMLRRYGFRVKNIGDTFLLYYLIDENAKNIKLKNLVWKVLGAGGYETEYDSVTENRSAAGVPTEILLKYNANDAYATKLLWDALLKKVDAQTIKLLNNLVLPFQEVLIETMHRGLKVDVEYAKAKEKEFQAEMEKIEQELYELVGRKFDIFSTQDLQKILFSELKLKCVKRTVKTNSPSVDEEALSALAGQHKVVDLLLAHRKLAKLVSTYFKPMVEKVDENGILHPLFVIGGTRTGRLSSRMPNCQNIPRGSLVKNLFIARPGNILIDLDFKQIEFRMAGHLARDTKMRMDIINGLDIHREVASRVFRVPVNQVTDQQRTQAKGAVFGILFGRGPKSLAKEYGMSEEDARKIISTFLNMYPSVGMWIKMTQQLVRRQGFLRNDFGRIRHFPGIFSDDKEIVMKTERQAVNFLPQSMAADYTFFRAVRLAKLLEPFDTGLILTVHDSLIYEAPLKHIESVLEIIFTELSKQLDFIFIPMEFELSIGFRLGETTKINSREDLDTFLRNNVIPKKECAS